MVILGCPVFKELYFRQPNIYFLYLFFFISFLLVFHLFALFCFSVYFLGSFLPNFFFHAQLEQSQSLTENTPPKERTLVLDTTLQGSPSPFLNSAFFVLYVSLMIQRSHCMSN